MVANALNRDSNDISSPDKRSSESTVNKSRQWSRRQFVQYAALGTGATALSGCAGNITGGGSDSDPYKIGVHLPLSQGYKLLGESFTNALKIARDEVNDNGGIAGRSIKYFIEDNQVDPRTGVQKANKLIQQDDIDLMVGPVNSSMLNAIAPIMKKHSMPLLYWLPYGGKRSENYCNRYIFNFGPTPLQQWKPAVPWMMKEGGERFFLIGKDTSYSRALNTVVKNNVEKNGGTVVGNVATPINHTDFSSTLSKVRSRNTDVLYMTVVGKSVGAIQKQLYNRGMRDQLLEVGAAHDPINLAGTSPKQSAGVYNSIAYYQDLDNEVNRQFTSKFHDRYGEDSLISPWTGLAYNTIKTLSKALDGADSISTETVMNRLPKASMNGVAGETQFAHDHQLSLRCNILRINKNIQFEMVKKLQRITLEDNCSKF